MNPVWAVRLPIDSARAAAGVRLEPQIEVLETSDAIWLRGDSADERLNRLLWQLPGARRFDVLPGGELRPLGSRLPSGQLPTGAWARLKTWAQIELPTAAFAAVASTRAPLTLVRCPGEGEANVLLTTLSAWAAYGDTAPQVRLARLRFAVSAEGAVVVHGQPLPPLPGERYCERSGVAVPCGWGWSPAVEPELLRDAWKLRPHDLALVSTDGTWDHLRGDQFVRATRSAIRETAADDAANKK
jgi:hypothetical protein